MLKNILEGLLMAEEMRKAEETVDEGYNSDIPMIKVSDLGLPVEQISVSLTEKDIGAFWRSKERILYIILAVCAVYFLGILFQGGFFAFF